MDGTPKRRAGSVARRLRRWAPAFAGAAVAALLASPAFAAAAEGEGNPNLFTGDVGNAIWTLLIFGLVVWVLGKYAWGPILSGLQQREAFIADSLEQAKSQRDEAERRLKEYTERIANARNEATQIVEEGRRDAEAVKQRIQDEAKGEAEAMIQRAKREIDISKETALEEIYSRAASLATLGASRILEREINAQDQERLINDAIADLDRLPTH